MNAIMNQLDNEVSLKPHLLVQELKTLERFQPRDPEINLLDSNSFENFVKKQYRPKANIEYIYQLTTLALLMSYHNPNIRTEILASPYFKAPLLNDIIYCLNEILIDP